jgi:hypothetical protein
MYNSSLNTIITFPVVVVELSGYVLVECKELSLKPTE